MEEEIVAENFDDGSNIEYAKNTSISANKPSGA